MALSMKDALVKDNVLNFIADMPAYAFIAYANLAQVARTEYSDFEYWCLKHGWLILLIIRTVIALYDLVIRLRGNYWIVDQEGKPRHKSLWSIIVQWFKEQIK